MTNILFMVLVVAINGSLYFIQVEIVWHFNRRGCMHNSLCIHYVIADAVGKVRLDTS
jgi:hypothetical protein